MKKLILVIILILIVSSCATNNVIIFAILEDDEVIQKYLSYQNIEFENADTNLVLKRCSNTIIMDLINIEYRKIQINKENIKNSNITKTNKEKIYRRKYLSFQDGKIVVCEDISSENKLVYDPTHPDSYQIGEFKGYVEYPNINFQNEIDEYTNNVYIFNSIVKYINIQKLNIAVSELPYDEYSNY